MAVNTADNRLEIIDPIAGVSIKSIPVGLEPVSVRARNDNEAWVVNHLSDTVSVVDINTGGIIDTLHTGDEPADVVFAGTPIRAFVTVSQRNKIAVFDPDDLSQPPTYIDIQGEDPRALATDGATVYAAIFQSGNKTAAIGEQDVSNPLYNPYMGTPNPVPNFGQDFQPAIDAGLPTPPPAGLIVKKDQGGNWLDDNGGDWTQWAIDKGFDLHDHDVAIINADSLDVSYASGLMTANMSIATHPGGGAVVVGTESSNEIRFEPNLVSRFIQVKMANIDSVGSTLSNIDLNPHIDYTQTTLPEADRIQSIGDPRGAIWAPAADRLYVTGMGSNNVIEMDTAMERTATIIVGEGPTGIRVDADFLYVLNRFEATVSIVDRVSSSEINRIPFYDPTPQTIRNGRPFLYNTHLSSGLGQAACASCHLDGRTDKLAWDLSDPQGEMKTFDQTCSLGACEDWHPMKGPFATQTLVGLSNTDPFHWRGDQADFQQFNSTFVSLLGREAELTTEEMAAFENFVMTLRFPPNPNRDIDGSPPAAFEDGNAFSGLISFLFNPLDHGIQCSSCHPGVEGTNGFIISDSAIQSSQSLKAPQLRNLFEKTGRNDSPLSNSGFGFGHDGSFDSLSSFFDANGFNFIDEQEKRDVAAYMMSFSTDFHSSVGVQITIPSSTTNAPATVEQLITYANDLYIDVVAKISAENYYRGFVYVGNNQFQSDRSSEVLDSVELMSMSSDEHKLTFTAVPYGSGIRMGIDRDEDGFYDRDEIDSCANAADPNSIPNAQLITGDVNQDGLVNLADIGPFVDRLSNGQWSAEADINCDGLINLLDIGPFVDLLSGS